MAQVIKIKRSTGTSAPGTLAQGELAYSKGSDTFYVGAAPQKSPPLPQLGRISARARCWRRKYLMKFHTKNLQ